MLGSTHHRGAITSLPSTIHTGIVLAGFMFLQGTQFLVYTISIGDLLLNAVALEFVISTDELLYSSLAPAHAKRFLSSTEGFKLRPSRTWQGEPPRPPPPPAYATRAVDRNG